MRYLGALAVLGLTVYALIDCVRTRRTEVRSMPKALWLAVVLLVPLLGPVAWIVAGRDGGGPAPTAPAGPVAPDDDPAFLRRLDQERRRAERERLTGTPPPATGDDQPGPGDRPATGAGGPTAGGGNPEDPDHSPDTPDEDDGSAGVR